MIVVDKFLPEDRPVWEELFRAYMDFYGRDEPQEMYDRAWREFEKDDTLHALGARLDGQLIAIAHFLVHPGTSGPDFCYLEDLFTAAASRGQGAASSLILAVKEWARTRGCGELYWQTHESNGTARRLYDEIAENRGFIVYEMQLQP
jgi:GNAT superfamily N-acetyltransferase